MAAHRLLDDAFGDDGSVLPLVQVLDYFIVCHEEADQGRTVTEEFIESLTEVCSILELAFLLGGPSIVCYLRDACFRNAYHRLIYRKASRLAITCILSLHTRL
jgi:hypothetical protein